MATPEQIAQVRRNVSELEDVAPYTDAVVEAYIDDIGDVDAVSALIWEEKASSYAELVDISEAGSSRKNGSLYKNATDRAAYFSSRTAVDDIPEPGSYSTTRRIVRT
jgi:hypothetical protein